jgi:hypothetical protein
LSHVERGRGKKLGYLLSNRFCQWPRAALGMWVNKTQAELQVFAIKAVSTMGLRSTEQMWAGLPPSLPGEWEFLIPQTRTVSQAKLPTHHRVYVRWIHGCGRAVPQPGPISGSLSQRIVRDPSPLVHKVPEDLCYWVPRKYGT